MPAAKGASSRIIIATPEEVREYGSSPWLVLAPALKEGRVVYAA
jgi:hypothetical protein